jgi:hypothetical protein
MGTKMYHPELPDAEIDVVLPAGVDLHRLPGWRTADEMSNNETPNSETDAALIEVPSTDAVDSPTAVEQNQE